MKYALLGSVVVLAAGCQQPTGPGTPALLTPGVPLSSNTRVPPPPTGHVGSPNGYVQGQASATMAAGDLVASAAAPRGAAPASSEPSSEAAAVQPVGYVESASLGPAMPTPSIPAEAFVGDLPPRSDDVPLRPHLRGMEPIDLTPVQQAPSSGFVAVAENASASPSQPSTAQAYRPSPNGSNGDNWSEAGATDATPATEPRTAEPRNVPADASPSAEPSSDGATQSVGDSLPWRKPTTAR